MRQRESGSIFIGTIIVVGVFFLFFWGVRQVLSQEWFLLRKKSAWVEKMAISKPLILKQNQAPISLEKNHQVHNCDLYRQKILIRNRQLEGDHSLNISDCYSDPFYRLHVDFYLDAVSSHQNISYAYYYYKVNNDNRALEDAVLVELAKVDENLVLIVIQYENQQYNYRLPLLGDEERVQYQLVKGANSGVMIVINKALWFLSFTGEVKLVTRDLPFQFESILLSAFISMEGRLDNSSEKDRLYSDEVGVSRGYFLVQSTTTELRLYSIDVVGISKEIGRWNLQNEPYFIKTDRIPGYKIDLNLGNRVVERLDQVGMIVLFNGTHQEDDQLFAIDWQGRPLWGDQAFWMRSVNSNIHCGLQQSLFEPVQGWILGCQRLRESKIVIE